jgi:LAS superfamily LD-carboxypeptidase LdcB
VLVAYSFVLRFVKNRPEKDNAAPIAADSSKVARNKTAVVADSSLSVEYLMGKFNPAKDTTFIHTDTEYANSDQMYLKKEAYLAFIRMFYAAQKDGVKIFIISATRNFAYQKGIWEAKWNGSRLVENKNLASTIKDPVERALKILKYSSMPGTSRHHWGTDMDLNSMDPKYFESANGKKVYEWLSKNASDYGFCQPYTAKGTSRPDGYEEEKWHWSYLPLASNCMKQYLNKVNYSDIAGFKGAETAEKIGVIEKYVKSVSCN